MLARFKSATSGTGTGYPGPCHILPIESLISIFNHPLVVLILPDSPVAPMKSTRENDVIDVSGGRWGGGERWSQEAEMDSLSGKARVKTLASGLCLAEAYGSGPRQPGQPRQPRQLRHR